MQEGNAEQTVIQTRIQRLLQEIDACERAIESQKCLIKTKRAQVAILEDVLRDVSAVAKGKGFRRPTNLSPHSPTDAGSTAYPGAAQTSPLEVPREPVGPRLKPTEAILDLLERNPGGLLGSAIVSQLADQIASRAGDKRRVLHQTLLVLTKGGSVIRDAATGLYVVRPRLFDVSNGQGRNGTSDHKENMEEKAMA